MTRFLTDRVFGLFGFVCLSIWVFPLLLFLCMGVGIYHMNAYTLGGQKPCFPQYPHPVAFYQGEEVLTYQHDVVATKELQATVHLEVTQPLGGYPSDP